MTRARSFCRVRRADPSKLGRSGGALSGGSLIMVLMVRQQPRYRLLPQSLASCTVCGARRQLQQADEGRTATLRRAEPRRPARCVWAAIPWPAAAPASGQAACPCTLPIWLGFESLCNPWTCPLIPNACLFVPADFRAAGNALWSLLCAYAALKWQPPGEVGWLWELCCFQLALGECSSARSFVGDYAWHTVGHCAQAV